MPSKKRLTIIRRPEQFVADKRRVITRPFLPGNKTHLKSVLSRILGLSEADVSRLLSEVVADFSARHRDILGAFEAHYNLVCKHLNGRAVSRERRLLIGAYFTKEYSVEAAALFNPSIVPHPDQSGLAAGRVPLHHQSSRHRRRSHFVDRIPVWSDRGRTARSRLDPARVRYRHDTGDHQRAHLSISTRLTSSCSEMGIHNDIAEIVLENLPPQFTADDLKQGIAEPE